MSRPTIATVRRALEATPVVVRKTVWQVVRVKALGKKYKVNIRQSYFGYYDWRKEIIVLGRCVNRRSGQASELVKTHIHEVLHKVRPDWDEDVVAAMEHTYFHSRALREASMLKLLNVTIFGRDPDVEAHDEEPNGEAQAGQPVEAEHPPKEV